MSNNKVCMGCMHPLPEGREECGICGYPANGDNTALYLSVRTVLSERYLVGKMLESVGDAAVYIGYDQVLKAPILIREFLPDTLCERLPNGELRIISGCEKTFHDYFEKFRSHARALARMRDLTSIVAVYDIFEQNHTAYTVSEYIDGNTLDTRLEQVGGRMRWDEARPLFMPLMASLISLHSAGIYHLGISPQNLILGTDGKLRLQGFSIAEARKVSSDLRPKLIPGYSAPEQYGFGQETGAWSDVYGLAATIFRTLTGNPPPEGSKRAKDSNDLLVPADAAKGMPDYVASALFNALQVNPESRIRTMQKFRDQISTAPAVSALLKDEKDEEETPPVALPVEEEPDPPKKGNKSTKYAVLVVVIIFILLLLVAGISLLLLFPDLLKGNGANSSSSTVVTTLTTTATTQKVDTSAQYAVSNVVGKNYFDNRDTAFSGQMKLQVEYEQYSDRPKGEILSQTPTAESMAAQGTTIKVVISAGPETIQVPDVSGWNYNQAELYLKALGFKVNETRIVSDTVDKDIVESIAEAGQNLKEGDTVHLRVSDSVLTTAAPTTTTQSGFSLW